MRLNLAACLTVAALAACGGGDDSPHSNEPLPLAVGNQWQYHYSTAFPYSESGVSTYKVSGTTKIDGVDAFVVNDDFRTGGDTHTTPYATSESGVTRYPASDATAEQIADGPQIALRQPLTVGDRWTNVSRTVDLGFDYDEDGTNEVEVTESHSAVGDTVSVSTFAGNFSTAYPIETFHRRQFKSPVTGEVFDTELDNIKEWYVIGVGVVRRETYFQPYGGWRDFHSTEILSAYHVN